MGDLAVRAQIERTKIVLVARSITFPLASPRGIWQDHERMPYAAPPLPAPRLFFLRRHAASFLPLLTTGAA
ncbi:MAG: hypothetical protein WC803_05480 [Sphingomonas sp.]